MNIGIEFGLTKIKNSSIEDIANINAFGNSLANSINSLGIKTIIFKITNEKNSEIAEQTQLFKLNSIYMDFIISIDFNKDDSTANGAYAYALGKEETIIANNILTNISSIFINNGVRVGNKKLLLQSTNAKTIILTPYNLISENDIEKLNQTGLRKITDIIAKCIVSSIE